MFHRLQDKCSNELVGPYSPAVLRFEISFPESYPYRLPLVLFSTDMFHPLITPLTTHMYSTDMQDNGPANATDDEILPPGGFSLRHGFPEWFKRNKIGSKGMSDTQTVSVASGQANDAATGATISPESSAMQAQSSSKVTSHSVSIYSMLKYIRSTFDTAEVLDTIPLAASGNPGAWHAWRTHRRKQGHLIETRPETERGDKSGEWGGTENDANSIPSPSSVSRRPGEWNWDGVWEARVKKGIAASLSEPALYGGSGIPDEMVGSYSFSQFFNLSKVS